MNHTAIPIEPCFFCDYENTTCTADSYSGWVTCGTCGARGPRVGRGTRLHCYSTSPADGEEEVTVKAIRAWNVAARKRAEIMEKLTRELLVERGVIFGEGQ